MKLKRGKRIYSLQGAYPRRTKQNKEIKERKVHAKGKQRKAGQVATRKPFGSK